MFVVTVRFVIDLENKTQFMQAMHKQAEDSLALEENCSHFDVCEHESKQDIVFLYELYQTQEDFKLHLKSDHFISFDAKVRGWVLEKTVECFTLANGA